MDIQPKPDLASKGDHILPEKLIQGKHSTTEKKRKEKKWLGEENGLQHY